VFISYRGKEKNLTGKYNFQKAEAVIVQYKFSFNPIFKENS
jgi:hypothetical protein